MKGMSERLTYRCACGYHWHFGYEYVPMRCPRCHELVEPGEAHERRGRMNGSKWLIHYKEDGWPCVEGEEHKFLTGAPKIVGKTKDDLPIISIVTKKCKVCGLDALTEQGIKELFGEKR